MSIEDLRLQFLRGNTTQNNAYTGADGELTVDALTKDLRLHDGATKGGFPLGGKLHSDITVTVGSGGDFSTINDAIEWLCHWKPMYLADLNQAKATIMLKAGFVMREQVIAEQVDLHWIVIQGEDAETVVDSTAIARSYTEKLEGTTWQPLFGAFNCRGISVDQLFAIDNTVSGVPRPDGYVAFGPGATGYVGRGAGIKNVTRNGLYAINGGVILAKQGIIDSNGIALLAVGGGEIVFDGGQLLSSGAHAYQASNNGEISAVDSTVGSCGGYLYIAHTGGTIVASNTTVDETDRVLYVNNGGTLVALNTTVGKVTLNSGANVAAVTNPNYVDLERSTINGIPVNTYGSFSVDDAGFVNVNHCTFNSDSEVMLPGGKLFRLRDGVFMSAENVTATGFDIRYEMITGVTCHAISQGGEVRRLAIAGDSTMHASLQGGTTQIDAGDVDIIVVDKGLVTMSNIVAPRCNIPLNTVTNKGLIIADEVEEPAA